MKVTPYFLHFSSADNSYTVARPIGSNCDQFTINKKSEIVRKSPLRFLIILLVLIITALGIGYFYVSHPNSHSIKADTPNATNAARPGGGRRNMPLPPVQAAMATEKSVPQYLSGLGTVTASNTVTLRSRVDGQLMALHFTEGQQVKTGDLLAEIDPRPYQVVLTQALGQLNKDQATLDNARRDLTRYQQLVKTNLISRQELDTQQSLVRQSEGAVAVDQGAVDSAKLQLTYSKITSPIDGRVGLKQVDIGNIISSSDTTGIVVLTQTQPIDVIFTLPEASISTIVQSQQTGQPLSVEAWDRTNQHQLTQGTLLTLDNQIDVTTGTIKLKARFDNQDNALFPNQFVNARLKIGTLQNAVVVPTAAVQMGNDGHFVWIVDSDKKVSKHIITTGMQDSQQTVVIAGLSAGENVVTDGIDRLTEGATVEVIQPETAAQAAAAADKAAEKHHHQRKS
ncbi:MdtA/MuxA family multidrug efflux RND transporter periplasmic adaptor subunit [Ewingella americana]|uniref:Multidrug resistance protein MdtA n=1 Tax=Ewingella americana TaxID=41202 RepID=A0A502GRJ7_9GAMM|nr:MdtA/MuxA family multidrug efflux RND transporter periplasmic adaptor subunit [Ewingella americana]